MEVLEERIKRHEGFRGRVYLDTEGKLTCGWGHYLWPGSKVPLEVCEIFFKQDIADAMAGYTTISPFLRKKLNPARERVIVEMIFNMNVQKVMQFREMWKYIEVDDFENAGNAMLDSKWATQVGNRAIELAGIMKGGID